MVSTFAFLVFSLVVVLAAWRVVASPNVVRAALALVVVLAGLAPIYLMLAAEFIAVVQVLVYVGAVVVLFLFGIMLTRGHQEPTEGIDSRKTSKHRSTALIVSAALFALLTLCIRGAFGGEELEPSRIVRTADVGRSLLSDYVIPFEAVSVLLLASLVGAIVLARRD